MAGVGGLCQPWIILSIWNSYCCCVGILVRIKRERALDRNPSWCFPPISSALHHHHFDRLGKAGFYLSFHTSFFSPTISALLWLSCFCVFFCYFELFLSFLSFLNGLKSVSIFTVKFQFHLILDLHQILIKIKWGSKATLE